MFISIFVFFSGENKKILLQSGKGIPKSLWSNLLDQFFLRGGGGGGEVCYFAIFLRET
jgi:hypothetical protein